ncbi:hypothetical protein OnM2_021025 [Erysiphe neolycopersici]|uniref:Uncharacterized protein n=1 Tax=Erysiphe neolycopersici TaxID=212602 RepID=A0A420I322_9PEZI|nr:hypothetical protein OnM2_021025 [Erysiphe neolycopersici]
MKGRRAFRYPLEDSDENNALQADEFLDEEGRFGSPTTLSRNLPSKTNQLIFTQISIEQDNLIQSLDDENTRTNQLYTRILLVISLISISPYLRTIVNPELTLFSILSITSLLSTAYLLVSLPPGQTNIAIIDYLSQSSIQKPTTPQYISLPLPSHGPIKQVLPYLNIGLCVTLVLLGSVIQKRAGSLWFGLCFIPIINYGAVLITACFMRSIDPQKELCTLKYEYKGA